MSMKVAKSIGLLYKLKKYITLYTSLIHPYLSYGIDGVSIQHVICQNNTSKIFVLQKKAMHIHAINNLAYNEHTVAPSHISPHCPHCIRATSAPNPTTNI